MTKYSVPITTKTLAVHIVEARNGSEAAFIAAEHIALGKKPEHTTTMGRSIGTARPLLEDSTPPDGK